MIPRHQTILFIVLLIASVVMGVLLWQLRDRAHQRLIQGEDSAPTQAPEVAPAEQATLFVANDADNSMQAQILSLPLPQSSSERVLCWASCSISTRLPMQRILFLEAQPQSPRCFYCQSRAVAQPDPEQRIKTRNPAPSLPSST